ncbi:Uncharacterized protein Cob_v012486 [Colletotrichum orbiculare MAFF 240422]|uniref:Duf1479 domain protein n=1 Tax=Colletotrichum orbiculare (strain 104-T / ATCC 96160 / CBS 514.97 / LARS 414 / MAFF 240422) TaxID=1213857 RepID=A0A484F9C8_COLOR|nr:Uncharacterized protein Cob_v012486 [Colletotrichum orbiculare MAFF 240422]
MPGRVQAWPAWAEYTEQGAAEAKDPDFLDTKSEIISEYGADALKRSWIAVCEHLNEVTEEIIAKGHGIIPVLDAAELLDRGFTDDQQREAKRIGAFVIRGVIPKLEADHHYANLKQYVADNKDKIQGWPKESPSMLMLYDSPVQNALRSHPNQLRLQRILNGLWHDSSVETSPEPLVYYDGIRDRPPRQEFLGLGPHIDAGSLCRWADKTYRNVYSNIFAGEPGLHDCYDLGLRKAADQELYPGIAHSSVFRSFQGWTALTRTAPNEGTVLVYPNVAAVVSYVMLRPFFRPPSEPADVMDEEVDFGRVFGMEPGDTVWWHADVCHAVDPEHQGSENASAVYIAACPSTPNNKAYVKRQLEETRAGRPPPDYAEGNSLDERTLKGYDGLGSLSDEAKRAFGFEL